MTVPANNLSSPATTLAYVFFVAVSLFVCEDWNAVSHPHHNRLVHQHRAGEVRCRNKLKGVEWQLPIASAGTCGGSCRQRPRIWLCTLCQASSVSVEVRRLHSTVLLLVHSDEKEEVVVVACFLGTCSAYEALAQPKKVFAQGSRWAPLGTSPSLCCEKKQEWATDPLPRRNEGHSSSVYRWRLAADLRL